MALNTFRDGNVIRALNQITEMPLDCKATNNIQVIWTAWVLVFLKSREVTQMYVTQSNKLLIASLLTLAKACKSTGWHQVIEQ